MFSGHNRDEFWLGLDDQANEGDFRLVSAVQIWLLSFTISTRWSHNKLQPVYANFSDENEHINNDNYDCVKFSGSGWQVASDFCENVLMPFVCKAPGLLLPCYVDAAHSVAGAVCESSDGVICDEMRVREREEGGLSAGVIAAIVIIILVIICVIGQHCSNVCLSCNVPMEIVVVVVLLLLWKFKNETFRQYICPCVGRGSKQALMSLQQENQRLRQELNQSKMNTSTRFTSSGQFGEVSSSLIISAAICDGTRSRVSVRSARWTGRNAASPQSRNWWSSKCGASVLFCKASSTYLSGETLLTTEPAKFLPFSPSSAQHFTSGAHDTHGGSTVSYHTISFYWTISETFQTSKVVVLMLSE